MLNFKKVISVSALIIFGTTNLLAPLSYVNAVTGYDSLTGRDLTHSALSFIMPNHNVSLYAITEANKYFVIYNGNTHTSGTMGTGTFTYDETGTLAPNAFEKTGYTWSEWNRHASGDGAHYASGAEVFNWTTVENDEINIYAQWTPNTYTIDYDLNKGSATSSPSYGASHPTTATYDSGFTVNNPSMQGYMFSGWTITNMDSEKHIIGTKTSYATGASGVMATSFENLRATDGVVHFLATWDRNQHTTYKVKHYLEKLEGGYPATPDITDNLSGPTDTEVTPAARIYEGFTANGENTPASGNIDPDGNKVFRYEYTRNSYDLGLVVGRGVVSVTATGTVNTTGITTNDNLTGQFKYDEPVNLSYVLKKGYEDPTWSGYSGTVVSFTMPHKNVTKELSATPIQYTITQECRGGDGCTKTTTYTVESGDITLPTPTRGEYSIFLGWTGGIDNEITIATKSLTITSGSINNRVYSANWKCVTGYHTADTGSSAEKCAPDTHVQYRVNEKTQELDGTSYIVSSGYYLYGTSNTQTQITANTYEGFTLSGNISEYQTNIDREGKTVVNVFYNRNSYDKIITNPVGGAATAITSANAVGLNSEGSQIKYKDTVTLNANMAYGYEFDYWEVKDESNNSITVTNSGDINGATFTMPASAVTITPHLKQISYTITYDLNSGTVAGNPTTYTVETPNITLIDPTRDHSVFLGWTRTERNELFSGTIAINQGSIGSRKFVANWGCMPGYHASGANECIANQYSGSVNYNDGTSHGAAEVVAFTYDKVTTIENPSQLGYDFVGWEITGMSGGVNHHLGTITTTGDSVNVDSGATEFYNLSTEQGMTNIKFTAIWSPRDDTKYIVNHYIKNVNNNTYTLSGTVEHSGTTDTPVKFIDVDKEFFGFTYSGGYVNQGGTTRPEGAGVTAGNIAKDGSAVFNLYYDRNVRTVTLSGDENIASLSWTGDRSFEYGDTVNVNATAKTGYHLVRWEVVSAP